MSQRRFASIASDDVRDACDSLDQITERLRAFRIARDWQRYHTPKNLAVSVAIECGELLEHFQWRSDDEVQEHLETQRQEVAAEIADVAIYAIQLADVAGIRLADAVDAKLAANAERYPVELAHGSRRKHTELRGTG